ncbi:MAG: hypothetical protein K6G88_12440 [Lachnospiraceae bacterium]|nr:hypothetical protein [Lachnospiraceae bacterium]
MIVFRPKEVLFAMLALLLYFQIYIQLFVSPFQYFDEALSVLFFLYFMMVLSKRLQTSHCTMLIMIVAVVIIGLMGNYTAGVRTDIKPIINDMGNTIKLFLIYLGASSYLYNHLKKEYVVKYIAFVFKGFVGILFVCMLLHFTGIVNFGTDVRFGLNSFQFVNNGAGQLSVMMYAIIMMLTADLKNPGNVAIKKMFIIMALIVWISTLRSRAFMFVAIYCFVYYTVVIRKGKFKLNIKNGIVILGILYMFGVEQAESYFANDKTARANLLRYGIRTMKDYFPIGAGFGTYGTDVAAKFYSPLYVKYGFNRIYGLAREYSVFARDSYWPAIMGQFGFLGLIAMVVLIGQWVFDVLKKTRYNKYTFVAGIFIAVTQVVSSIATATFFNFVTVAIFFMIPLIFSDDIKQQAAKFVKFR